MNFFHKRVVIIADLAVVFVHGLSDPLAGESHCIGFGDQRVNFVFLELVIDDSPLLVFCVFKLAPDVCVSRFFSGWEGYLVAIRHAIAVPSPQ
jgi:hypothetical protein